MRVILPILVQLIAVRGSQYSSVHAHSLSVSTPNSPAFLQKEGQPEANAEDDAEDVEAQPIAMKHQVAEDTSEEEEKEKEEEEEDVGQEQAKPIDEDFVREDLPPGWKPHWSEEYNRVYYANSETGDTTWTRPQTKSTKPQKKPSKAAVKDAEKEQELNDVVPKPHYKARVKAMQSHEHHVFSKGIIVAVIVLCLTACLASNSNDMISSNTWSTLDAVITVFLSLMWYHVVVHFLDFGQYAGVEKLIAHCTIGVVVLFVCSMISLYMQKRAEKEKTGFESASIFNAVSDPMVMWCNAGAISTAQQLAKPSKVGVLMMTGFMVLYFVVLAVFWYHGVGRIVKDKRLSEGTLNNLTGGALAGGIILWIHMMIIGSYQTIEDPHPNAPGFGKTLVLNCFGMVYIAFTCVFGPQVGKLLKKTDKDTQYVKWRMISVLNHFVALLPKFSCVLALGHLIVDNLGYQEGAIQARLLNCVVSTLIGFGLIVLCAKVNAINKELTEILVGLGGFMAGAAWAGLLNNSIDQMAKGYKHPFMSKLEVTGVLTACVLPTYFYYLKPLINEKLAADAAS